MRNPMRCIYGAVAAGVVAGAFLSWMGDYAADASNCAGYPYTLTNGTTADANQVMANFNNILSCANSNLAHNAVNSDITQLTAVTNLAFSGANSNITSLSGLTTPLSVAQGGTGGNTASTARTNLGLGTSSIENLLSTVIDDGAGNLKVGNSGVTLGTYTNATITVGLDGRVTSASNGATAATSASVGQMETGTATNVFASPGTMPYAQSAIKAYIAWKYTGGVLTTFGSFNASVSRVAAGNFTVSIGNSYNFNFGLLVCNGHNSGNPLLASPAGNISGLTPSEEVDFLNTGGVATDPGDNATCVIVGSTNN